MKRKIPLRTRLFLVMSALVGITVMGGLVMIWYTHRIEGVLNTIIEKDIAAYQAAETLQVALINQKGFVTYYFQDGNPDWLRQLGEYRQIFRMRLLEAYSIAENPHQRETLARIEKEYEHYTATKDKVIGYYKSGLRQEGAILHQSAREHFYSLIELCENYKKFHTQGIMAAKQETLVQAVRLRIIAVSAMIGSIGLAVVLSAILIGQILQPVNRMFEAASRSGAIEYPNNVVAALSQKVHGLIEDMDQTHLELARSRESLLQAEKLAMVGKLAAGMAHSIRNPFTSVKMRLFSLNRSLELNDEQKEDFQVISEEIRHIDTIVQNFLEFSRPPKLKMQVLSPSSVVDMAVQLLQHRLKSYDVAVTVERGQTLPEVSVDPEQLKEVLVNLIINACEAMVNGGQINITERTATDDQGKPMIELQVTDTGPGIPENLTGKVFQPFFTTKEEGTGLGLSIVERIIHEHGGKIRLEPNKGLGAKFIITLPVLEFERTADCKPAAGRKNIARPLAERSQGPQEKPSSKE
ncbi:MAG: histidine kinase [Desulfobacteraceae bacterium]|nr:MAG: histidine kinase [Desulfobacteraceae bacterium]